MDGEEAADQHPETELPTGVGRWPQAFDDLIGAGLRLYIKQMGAFVWLALFASGLPAALAGLAQLVVFHAFGFNFEQGIWSQLLIVSESGGETLDRGPLSQWLLQPTPSDIEMLIAGAVLWLVAALFVSSWSIAALSLGGRDAVAGRPVRIEDALRGGLRRMWSVVPVQLLQSALVAVAFVMSFFAPILLFLLVLGVMTKVSESGSLAANALAIGLLLVATPAAVLLGACSVVVFSYFWVRFCLAAFAASVDNLSPFSALRQSWSLTRHNWWHTFVPVVVASVAAYLLTRIASLVMYASPTISILVAVPLMTALTAPLTTTIGLAVYYDLRLRRES